MAAPVVSGVAPASGVQLGGTSVVITGTDLTGATAVAFGVTPATSFVVDSSTQITAVSPAHAVGVVDITVTTPGGTSATGAADQFTYLVSLPDYDGYGIEVKKVVEFKTNVQRGISGGPALAIAYYASPLYHYEIPVKFLTPAQLAVLRAFYVSMLGQYGTFSIVDPESGATVLVRFETDQQEFDQILSGAWQGTNIKMVSA